jgi:hypothetical protein
MECPDTLAAPQPTDWPAFVAPADAVRLAAEFGIVVTLPTLASWRSTGRENGAAAPLFQRTRAGAIFYPRSEFIV